MLKIKLPKEEITHYWIGFSGGVDSLALLLSVKDLIPKKKLTAVHFQHGLRGKDAENDAEWCRQVCQQLSVNFLRVDLNVLKQQKQGESLEEAARKERLIAWQKIASSTDLILLGHHQDDVLEEFFIRIARGSGTSGITSLRPDRILYGRHFYRPLLSFRKKELKDFVLQYGYDTWCEDKTNFQNDVRRNAVRNRLLPLFREIFDQDKGLEISIQNLFTDAQFLEKQAKIIAQELTDLSSFRKIEYALFPRVLRYWIFFKSGKDLVFTKNEILRIWQGIFQENIEPVKIVLAKGQIILRLHLNEIRILKETIELKSRQWRWQESPEVELPEIKAKFKIECIEDVAENLDLTTPYIAFFDSEKFPAELEIRSRQAGDLMIPFKQKNMVKLKKLFIEKSILQEKRSAIPIVDSTLGILWVPGVKRSHLLTVKQEKSKIIKIIFEQKLE